MLSGVTAFYVNKEKLESEKETVFLFLLTNCFLVYIRDKFPLFTYSFLFLFNS